jgi:hypothetical protein
MNRFPDPHRSREWPPPYLSHAVLDAGLIPVPQWEWRKAKRGQAPDLSDLAPLYTQTEGGAVFCGPPCGGRADRFGRFPPNRSFLQPSFIPRVYAPLYP